MRTAVEPEGTVRLADRAALGEAVRFCVPVFVALRLLTLVIGIAAVAVIPPLEPVGVPGWPANPLPDPGWHNLVTAWERFDALWFLRIAEDGYRLGDGSAAFFPLYPLLVRAVSFAIGGHPFGASLLVSNAAFLAALVMTYLLTASEVGRRAARTTVVLLCFFPTSYFFLMPYSESVFLLLAVTAFWAARRGRWTLAGAAGMLAALTRSIGILLAPALVVEALHRRAETRERLWPGLLAAAATAVGTGVYLGWWWLRAGEVLAPVGRQANWERAFSWPWVSLWDATRYAFRFVGGTNRGYWIIDWVIVVPVLALAVYALRRYRPSFGLYVVGGLLLPLTFVFADRPLMSMPRFVLVLFPAFWAAAEAADRFGAPRWALAGAGAAGLGLLSLLTINWYYIF